jgi:hypothetical protein
MCSPHDSTYGGFAGAGVYCGGYTGTLSENTFIGCHIDPPYVGSAMRLGASSSLMTVVNNLVVQCSGGGVVWMQDGESPTAACNGFWNNEGGLA